MLNPIWLATGEGFGTFGKFSLVFAPLFNLVAGLIFLMVARELERKARLAE